jgi:putative endonuclease
MKLSSGKTSSAVQNTHKTNTRASTRARGQSGEDAAAKFLEAHGFQIVARNWRPGNALRGEIDCIAWGNAARPARVLCFVEVKARKNNESCAAQQAVNFAKQRQISRLANAFVSIHKLPETPCRFDVIEAWLRENGEVARCVLHRNAFDYCGEF